MARHSRFTERESSLRWAYALPVLRFLLVAAGALLTWLLIRLDAPSAPFPPPSMLACLAMLPVNLLSLWAVTRLYRATGYRLRDALGFDRGRIFSDLLWGLVWLMVLYLPFAGTLILVVWLMHGSQTFTAMETLFFDPAAIPALPAVTWTIIGVVVVVTFAPLNAPAEELVYRGYSQQALAVEHPVRAVLFPSLIFGLQHIWYAATPGAIIPFVCAFFVWGWGSALIVRYQGRLMPVVCAHGFVNLFLSLPALFVPFFLS